MPKKVNEYIYILSPSRAYLTYIAIMGPIVHPLKVSKSSVVKTLMTGAEVYEFIPKTKKTIKLTLSNINNPDRYNDIQDINATTQEVIIPIEKSGVPKISGVIDATEPPILEETETDKFDMPEFTIENGKVNESNINWSAYTKSQKKAIRAKINEINNK